VDGKNSVSRRNFIKKSAQATVAASMFPAILHKSAHANTTPSPLNKWPGRVVVNYNGSFSIGTSVNQALVKSAVDDSIKALTGESTVGDAWKSLFPSITQTTKIAVKINILNAVVPPHPFVVMGITEGLQQMNVGGSSFPAGNIYIYDANNGSAMDSAGFTAARFPGITRTKDSLSNHNDGAHNNQRYANTLYNCDYLINVPGLRGHDRPDAGNMTLGFKSHYGTYPAMYHDSNMKPYLRDINCTGPVYDKTVLTVCGAIYGMRIAHGPRGNPDSFLTYTQTMDPTTSNPNTNTILMSTDPVTLEFQAVKILRIRDGYTYTVSDMPDYLKISAGVSVSGQNPIYNIGKINEADMNVIEFINGTQTTRNQWSENRSLQAKVSIYPNPASPGRYSFIDCILPGDYSGKTAEIEILNITSGAGLFRNSVSPSWGSVSG
jgi:uncharacterized protein (DUF362 family)